MEPFRGGISQAWAIKRNGDGDRARPERINSGTPAHIIGCTATDGPSAARELEACFWWLLGTLESASDHPLAKGILSDAKRIEGLPAISAPSDFEYLSGRGVRCVMEQLGGAIA